MLSLMLIACGGKQEKLISAMIPIAGNKPDSALTILSKIDQTKLSDRGLALYSLVYTMAQDKSGIDVDKDSLLRYAHDWYKDKPDDSLYAKCEYYIGKYYSLNDSRESSSLLCKFYKGGKSSKGLLYSKLGFVAILGHRQRIQSRPCH